MSSLVDAIAIFCLFWLALLTGAVGILIRDYTHFKLASQNLDELKKSKSKEIIVPHKGGWFTTKNKRSAIVNDDQKAWEYEEDSK